MMPHWLAYKGSKTTDSSRKERWLIITANCTYFGLMGSLLCSVMLPRTRWIWPLVIITLVLLLFGRFAQHRRYIIEFSLVIFIIVFHQTLPGLAHIPWQSAQTVRAEQQQLHLVNQKMQLEDQYRVLSKQLPLLEQLQTNSDFIDKIRQHSEESIELIDYITYSEHYIYTNFIKRDSHMLISDLDYMNKRDEHLDTFQNHVKTRSKSINENKTLIIQANQILPADQQVTYQPRVALTQCPLSLCNPPSWQHSFIEGWQRISGQPLTVIWPFWLTLLIVIIFLLIGFKELSQHGRKVIFKVLKAESIALARNDQQRWIRWASRLTIACWGPGNNSLWWLGQSQMHNDEFTLAFNLGSGTKVLDVVLDPLPGKATFASNATSVTIPPETRHFLSGSPAEICFFMSPIVAPGVFKRPEPPTFTVIAENFEGNITSTTQGWFTRIWNIQHIYELRGSTQFFKVMNIFHAFFLYFSLFFVSSASILLSSYFFDGLSLEIPKDYTSSHTFTRILYYTAIVCGMISLVCFIFYKIIQNKILIRKHKATF